MSSTTASSASDATANMPELPAGFVPGDHDVVIGKGKKFYFHTGNQWLRTLVSSMLGEYKQAQTKSDKSNIISDVVEYVRNHGRFVKRDLKTGNWVYAEPLLCREKCSQTFRDNLAETYRSSNVAKRNKRRQEQQEKKRGGAMEMPEPKRMRAIPAAHAPTAATAAAPSISGNLFDLEMPLWSPKAQNSSVLSNNIDFSALVTRGSMTGATTTLPGSNNTGGFNLNMQSFNTNNAATANTNENLSSLLSNLLNNAVASAPAPPAAVAHAHEPTAINPFEPTPLQALPAMPPLTGNSAFHTSNGAATPTDLSASLSNFDANAIFGALENVLQQSSNRQQQKRHSLAPLGDDWFKLPAPTTTNDQDGAQNISAAFAA